MSFRWRKRAFLLLIFILIATALLNYRDDLREIPDRWHAPFLNPEPKSSLKSPADLFTGYTGSDLARHPINDLIRTANTDFDRLVQKQPESVQEAADVYRRRRGRHPPPNFDKWFDFAKSHNCLIVEDFFDQVYRDIEPFWGLVAADIRRDANTFSDFVRVRDGKVEKSAGEWQFVDVYFKMLKEIEGQLPNVILPINIMDESRVIVPWEEMDKLVQRASTSKNLHKSHLVTSFSNAEDLSKPDVEIPWLHEGPYWDIAKQGCHPNSSARNALLDKDFSTPPQFLKEWPVNSYKGYVANWTSSQDPCIHSHLRNIHGTFVEPISQSTTTKLVAIFSGSKLPFNNDILLPGAVYWEGDERFSMSHARISWANKRDEVLWRGSASGGRNKENNWTRFQRHRLLSMLNGTQIEMTSNSNSSDTETAATNTHNVPHNFPLPNQSLYPLESVARGLLPDWIRSLSNTAFTWLVCFPGTKKYGCSYTGAWYRHGQEIPLHRMFKAKYLPDVDGNSFSGRYRAFLQSNSLPIKATIYNEWHDDRLVAWKHFVPMDNTFMDLWAILEYLVARDDVAEKIAVEGGEWARRVLRKEDMLVYVYRLILEYARVSSDAREDMGWSAS